MITKVILINSPIVNHKLNSTAIDSLPPFGLAYIASVLKFAEIDVNILDANAENLTVLEVVDRMEVFKPDFIGINIFTPNFELVKQIVENYKSQTHFIIGGQVTRYTYDTIIQFKTENHIDIVIGDGDYIVLEIVNNCIDEMPKIALNNRRVFEVDRNSKYFPRSLDQLCLDRGFLENEPHLNHYNQLEAYLITSRGCIYNCGFCGAARSLNQRSPIRKSSTQSVGKELDNIRKVYPSVTCIRILDDLFLSNKESIQNAIETFKYRDLSWRAMAHINTFKNIHESVIKQLKNSGCKELFVGIESGSSKILREINKSYDPNSVIEVIIKLLTAGIDVKGYFIFGFPNENHYDMELTYSLAKAIKEESLSLNGKFRTSVFQFKPYHGTSLYESIKEKFSLPQIYKLNNDIRSGTKREPFNLYNGNYSTCNMETITDFINKTAALNQQ